MGAFLESWGMRLKGRREERFGGSKLTIIECGRKCWRSEEGRRWPCDVATRFLGPSAPCQHRGIWQYAVDMGDLDTLTKSANFFFSCCVFALSAPCIVCRERVATCDGPAASPMTPTWMGRCSLLRSEASCNPGSTNAKSGPGIASHADGK